jgi:predicted transcriptional regulator
MPTSVRLDARTERVLERLARSRSQTKSEIVRQAIEALAAQERQRPFEAVADLIGCAVPRTCRRTRGGNTAIS